MPKPTPDTWRNRIVGYGVEDADQLLANPANWRIHPRYQQDALKGILNDVGWVQNIIVNRTTGHVIDGHMRAAVAISQGAQVPVTYVELTEAEERLMLAVLDPIAAMAARDDAQLAELLASVSAEDAGLADLLKELAFDMTPPTLDELATQHGESDGSEFDPVIRVQVPQDVYERYQSIIATCDGDTEGEKFATMLELIE